MTITVNGKPLEVEPNLTIQQLLEQLCYTPKAVAVALNETFVPRSEYSKRKIQELDVLEYLSPMAGG